MRWLLLSLFLIVGFVQSQEPPKAEAPDQKAKASERGSEQSPIFVKTPGPSTQAERDYEAYEKQEKPENERWMTRATLALAVITLGLAIFTALLWNATRKLVSDALDTSKRELRAYVALETVKWVAGDALKIRVQNYGQTPAHQMTIWSWSTQDEPPSSFTYPYPGGEPVSIAQMLHPGQAFNTRAALELSYTFVSTFFLYGRIVYRDIFERWWVTRFCYLAEGEGRFVPYGPHNREDGPYNSPQEALNASA